MDITHKGIVGSGSWVWATLFNHTNQTNPVFI